MLTKQQLNSLAKAMNVLGKGSLIDAGYTYVGQFISHDIVPSTRSGADSRHVTRQLNLDSIYAKDSERKGLLDDNGRFLITPATENTPEDLLRSPTGMALIPERRNDENIIVSQFHLFWQKFHNLLIDRKFARNAEDARRLTTLTFQLVVVTDYLKQILTPKVFKYYFESGTPARLLTLDRLRVPEEFRFAAFRFGHSMVRPFYKSIGDRPLSLKLLFRRARRLTGDFKVNWNGFFDWPDRCNKVQNANLIDPSITPTLTTLPDGQAQSIHLIKRNLLAGQTLPSGFDYVLAVTGSRNGTEISKRFELEPLEQLGVLEQVSSSGLSIQTLPLWPYILLEAWQQHQGQCLGTLGSLICAEVLLDSIADAKFSVFDTQLDLDKPIASMGNLGKRFSALMETHEKHTSSSERKFCMRHILAFGEEP